MHRYWIIMLIFTFILVVAAIIIASISLANQSNTNDIVQNKLEKTLQIASDTNSKVESIENNTNSKVESIENNTKSKVESIENNTSRIKTDIMNIESEVSIAKSNINRVETDKKIIESKIQSVVKDSHNATLDSIFIYQDVNEVLHRKNIQKIIIPATVVVLHQTSSTITPLYMFCGVNVIKQAKNGTLYLQCVLDMNCVTLYDLEVTIEFGIFSGESNTCFLNSFTQVVSPHSNHQIIFPIINVMVQQSKQYYIGIRAVDGSADVKIDSGYIRCDTLSK